MYQRSHTIPVDTKTKDFQYRFVHDILINRYWLYKWKLKDNAKCTYCNADSETIEHMFWSCDKSQEFWASVASLLSESTDQGCDTCQ